MQTLCLLFHPSLLCPPHAHTDADVSAATDYGIHEPLEIPGDLHGRRKDSVWYTEVKMFFTCSFRTQELEHPKDYDFAWIQWYEAFGTSSAADARVHRDPNFPDSLRKYFPLLYLPECNMGTSYDVILVSNIIAPAPVCDDVSLMREVAPKAPLKNKNVVKPKVATPSQHSANC